MIKHTKTRAPRHPELNVFIQRPPIWAGGLPLADYNLLCKWFTDEVPVDGFMKSLKTICIAGMQCSEVLEKRVFQVKESNFSSEGKNSVNI